MSTSGRLKMDQVDEAAALMVEEAWKRLRVARYRIPGKAAHMIQ
ncbi:MAG TPA: hypothetical protein VFA10_21785 [Ktedonobacteraceae bacterium]|jgi:hypothetical protein|nr:hypothetical protein [Ktedonobacteraceae bacterium]